METCSVVVTCLVVEASIAGGTSGAGLFVGATVRGNVLYRSLRDLKGSDILNLISLGGYLKLGKRPDVQHVSIRAFRFEIITHF